MRIVKEWIDYSRWLPEHLWQEVTDFRDFQDLLITAVWYSWLMPGKLKSSIRTRVTDLESSPSSLQNSFHPEQLGVLHDSFPTVGLILPSLNNITAVGPDQCFQFLLFFSPTPTNCVLVHEMLSTWELHTKLTAVW